MSKQKQAPKKQRYTGFGNSIKKRPEQLVVFNPQVERLVRIMAGVPQALEKNKGNATIFVHEDTMLNPPLSMALPFDGVPVATFHAGAQEFDIPATVVSACAREGYSARKILEVLQALRFTDNNGKQYPVLSVDTRQIESPAITHTEALWLACREVVLGNQIQEVTQST